MNAAVSAGMQRFPIAALAVLLSFTAMAMGERAESWRVVNPMTNPPTPISDSTIVIGYEGHSLSIAHSQRVCDRTEVVRSDSQGRFSVPAPRHGRVALVAAHKAGHAYPHPEMASDPRKREAYLIPNPTQQQRMEQMNRIRGVVGCRSSEDSSTKVASFLDEVIAEMRPLVTTKSDERTMRQLEYRRDTHRDFPERGRQ